MGLEMRAWRCGEKRARGLDFGRGLAVESIERDA